MNKETKNTILLIGGVAAGYFLVLQPLLQKLGLQKTSAEIQQEKKQKQALNDYIQSAKKNQQATKTPGEWGLIANQIWENLRYSALSDDKEAAGVNLSRPKNDADVAILIEQFGLRQEYYFGLPIGGLKDLTVFVNSNLSQQKINAINDNYSRKGIRFRF